MTVYKAQTEWLDTVAALPEADLPCNVSTVAYAIQVAQAYRSEAETWQRLFAELEANWSALDAGADDSSPVRPDRIPTEGDAQ